ncbi:MAG: Gfo/Idh/MocA family protein [Christensenellales bacterium]|jgi:dihydrodiol dehydrogenase / D-xylose 1-dehydrogenase (NADP)
MDRPIGWGLLAPGGIGRAFAASLALLPDARRVAVGSRSAERAADFAKVYGFERAWGGYEQLAEDPEVDVVYIASPHPMHFEQAMLCMDHGKSVLIEKPMTTDADRARRLCQRAAERGVFLMEAYWTRFMPAIRQAEAWVRGGRIGQLRMLQADFCFRSELDPTSRLFDPALAGGGLLDVGPYVLGMASQFFGWRPDRITGAAHIGDTGVDEQNAIVLGYPGGELALMTTAVRTTRPVTCTLYGTDGRIELPAPFYNAHAARLVTPQGVEAFDEPFPTNGYQFEIAEVMDCLRRGLQQSPRYGWEESVGNARIMDTLRAQWGLRFPFEEDCP